MQKVLWPLAWGCDGMPDSQSFRLSLTQAGSAARGVVELGGLRAEVSGEIGADGTLTLAGTGRQPDLTVNIVAWRSLVEGTAMRGTFGYAIVPDSVGLGTVTITAALQEVVKES